METNNNAQLCENEEEKNWIKKAEKTIEEKLNSLK